jgi:inosine/xanthosine triphosphate pyrophosphatase family protein
VTINAEPFAQNKISHRYKALLKLKAFLIETNGGGASK